jgi:hypothetical protein
LAFVMLYCLFSSSSSSSKQVLGKTACSDFIS